MTTITDYLNQLRALLGTKEQPGGSNYAPPITPWYADLVGNVGFARAPWCAMTVSYGLHHAGYTGFTYAYVPYIERDAKAGVNGMQWVSDPAPGRLVVYGFSGPSIATHVGTVETTRADGLFVAIEGNWGDACQRLVRDRTYVRGFVQLPLAATPTPVPPPVIPQTKEKKVFIVRQDGEPNVYLTDWVTKRWVHNQHELDSMIWISAVSGDPLIGAKDAAGNITGNPIVIKKTDVDLTNIPSAEDFDNVGGGSGGQAVPMAITLQGVATPQ